MSFCNVKVYLLLKFDLIFNEFLIRVIDLFIGNCKEII